MTSRRRSIPILHHPGFYILAVGGVLAAIAWRIRSLRQREHGAPTARATWDGSDTDQAADMGGWPVVHLS